MPEMIAPGVLNYASVLDETTRKQAEEIASLPFIYPHVALMPDAHAGKGSAVGTVIPTKDAVIPAAVGVDIGCGMIGVETWVQKSDIAGMDLALLRECIEKEIPLSPGNYNKNPRWAPHTTERIELLERLAEDTGVDLSHSPKWREQLGSLGGGNHFIELCQSVIAEYDDGELWLFLHSGSRGVGNKIAQKHIKIAQKLCKRWHVPLANPDLAYLPSGTQEFTTYLRELRWAQRFALENRAEMMDRFVAVFQWWLEDQGYDFHNDEMPDEVEVRRINCHHNYTENVTINGERVWLTRKGAIDASEGKYGLIPGSMGTKSYVVVGQGNSSGLYSAPHGAGRNFSRTEARKRFTADDLAKAMEGIEYRHGEEWIDEIPAAYKDIDQVIEDAKDLVTVETTLKQLVNIKGV
ncbi:tRNA splicing ligase [Gordonia phage Yvonnetastic]|uniref:3'-phosphate/5'-hydroxy nucleic acid ligase n=1 Tax=Gordonia phage Yvonnetastic TaxID=1821566 RepID=A0A142K931_9CAUD|nr:tRNA splicing ligase [Gordonia phage Yvonnetastic]AMS02614.1 RtcB-like RNA ligase [Gordonia phage Yvonnetastic]WKW86046.1 RNA ligase [Gordonia Phage JonJames]